MKNGRSWSIIEGLKKMQRKADMKKLIATVLALLMIAGLCGCDKRGGSDHKKGSSPATDSDLSWEEIQQRLEEEEAAEN